MSYERSASVYDAIYTAMKDYRHEAERVRELLKRHAQLPVRRLFDVACGTGLHTQYLRHNYEVIGVDNSPHQLAIARERLAGVKLLEADMQTFRVDVPADAIVCLFSAIGHLESVAQLNQAIANFAAQLRPGGVVLIEPWLMPGQWRPGYESIDFGTGPDLKVARVSRSYLVHESVNLLVLEHFVQRGSSVEHFTDYHVLRTFSETEFRSAFAAAGLNSEYLASGISNNGRGIFLAAKPLQ